MSTGGPGQDRDNNDNSGAHFEKVIESLYGFGDEPSSHDDDSEERDRDAEERDRDAE